MSRKFLYQNFVAVSANLGGKVSVAEDVLSSHDQAVYRTTSLDENWIELEIQTDRSYYVDLRQKYLSFKLKFFKCRG